MSCVRVCTTSDFGRWANIVNKLEAVSLALNTFAKQEFPGISIVHSLLQLTAVEFLSIAAAALPGKSLEAMLFIALAWGFVLSMKFGIQRLNSVKTIEVTDLKTFDDQISNGGFSVDQLTRISVLANCTISQPSEHPVIKALISRWKTGSKPGRRSFGDSNKIALSIEGGGMRGCVAAGASAALNVLGLSDAIDVVYGSSAGAMVGAYFISRQYSGVQIYHDILPAAGTRFIDKFKLLFAAGLPRQMNILARVLKKSKRKTARDMKAKPNSSLHFIGSSRASRMKTPSPLAHAEAINLDFLLNDVMGTLQGLDWETFTRNEAVQPLKVVASSIRTMKPIVLSRLNRNFADLPSLLECIRASMAVPGVTGSLMVVHSEPASGSGRSASFLPIPKLPWQWGPGAITGTRLKGLRVPTFIHDRPAKRVEQPDNQSGITVQTASEAIPVQTQSAITGSSTSPSSVFGVTASSLFPTSSSSSSSRSGGEDGIELEEDASLEDIIKRSAVWRVDQTARSMKSSGVAESAAATVAAVVSSTSSLSPSLEPIVDAFLCEPLPYRSAVEEGATHVIVLRTRPDPCPVLGKGPGFFEKVIAKRFFGRYREEQAAQWMMELNHHRIYAQDVLRLNEGCKGLPEGVQVDGKSVYLLPIAPAVGCKEVGQLETRRDRVLQGMQDGARRVFELFGPELIGLSGAEEIEELVQMIFPDEILDRVITLQDVESVSIKQRGMNIHQQA